MPHIIQLPVRKQKIWSGVRRETNNKIVQNNNQPVLEYMHIIFFFYKI